ncbi:response regulator transcription factor [Paenibacillus sp. NRS-1760]|uniref:response regulator transcription factor n=1 Tax=Paenibacillus sp. NRS-1760 TaxID=3233902 RepID=UPI003D2C1C32
MYKVVITDDESLIIESLKLCIDWEQQGFQIIGQALNGIDALELILEAEPDIVFTDIRMPGLNGLELMKKVSKTHPHILFVVISGYAEFAYAQKALKHGAIGYCLKPIEEDEIINVLRKAEEILLNDTPNKNEDLLELLADSSSIDSKQKLNSILKKKGFNITTSNGLYVIVSIGQKGITIPQNIMHVMIRLDFNKKVYIFEQLNNEKLIHFFESQMSEETISIGVSLVNEVSELKQAIVGAAIAAYQFFIVGRKGVFISKPIDIHLLDHDLKKLDKAIQQKDIALIDESYLSIKELFKAGEMNIRLAFKVYNTTMVLLFKYSDDELDTDMVDYEQLAYNFGNVEEMLSKLRELSVKHCNILNNNMTGKIDNTIIKQVLEYVNNNFYKAITVQNLSEMFFISPNYISSLFKREVGENFKEHLAKIRIDYACKLLGSQEYSIQQVAEKSGYSDYFYFSRIFKNMTGTTPSKFRSENTIKKT